MVYDFRFKNRIKAFTLIEILVSIVIFSLVVLVVISSLISVIKAKQLVLQKTYLYDSGRFILESIMREARVSRVDPVSSWTRLVLHHPILGIIEYRFTSSESTIHRIDQDGGDQVMNPGNVKINALFKNSSYDCSIGCTEFQPMRTIILIISDLDNKNEIILQSAVSQREIDL